MAGQKGIRIRPKLKIKCDQCGTDFAPFRSYDCGRWSKILMFPRFFVVELFKMLNNGQVFPDHYFDCPSCSAGMQHKMDDFRY